LGESWVVIVARALSDPTRYRMLQEIRAAGEMTCGELHARFPLSQATISHHIKTLQQAGLLRVRAEGLFRHLSAESSRLSAFAAGVLEDLIGTSQKPAREEPPPAAARGAHAAPMRQRALRRAAPARRLRKG
jgi:DNA-binding transcriptional ArsR family regulator